MGFRRFCKGVRSSFARKLKAHFKYSDCDDASSITAYPALSAISTKAHDIATPESTSPTAPKAAGPTVLWSGRLSLASTSTSVLAEVFATSQPTNTPPTSISADSQPSELGFDDDSHRLLDDDDDDGTWTVDPCEDKVEKSCCYDTQDEDDAPPGWWGTTKDIEESKILKLAREHIDPNGELKGGCFLRWKKSGTFNTAYIVQFLGGNTASDRLVIRIPHYADQWQGPNKPDAYGMRSWILTTKYIKRYTGLPLPEVLAYDITTDNILGLPYVIMECLEGKPVCEQWWSLNGSGLFEEAAGVSYGPASEAKRQRILVSIAKTMANFKDVPSFAEAGMLRFAKEDEDALDPDIGGMYRAKVGINDNDGSFKHETEWEHQYYDSYKKHCRLLRSWWERNNSGFDNEVQQRCFVGMLRVLRMMIELNPTAVRRPTQAAPEEFVLCPPDFDWQNVMIDDDCNVTGLLDWDYCYTQPSYLGWVSPPLFLQRDWDAYKPWSGAVGDTPADVARYRRDYAKYLKQASGNHPHTAHTHSAHLWRCLREALEDDSGELLIPFMEKVFAELLPGMASIAFQKYLCRLGDQEHVLWPGEREYIKGQLRKLFGCES